MSEHRKLNPEFQLAFTTPLLDSITINHGPRALLGRLFLLAVGEARRLGVRLQLRHDFHTFVDLNESIGASWGAPIIPILNPEYSDVTRQNAFWISGHDRSGRIISTQAARVVPMEDSSLRDEIESLRIFYRDPARFRVNGTACDVQCPAAERINGQGVYGGAVWVHPDFRKSGLARVLSRITRALSLAEWNCDYIFSFLHSDLVKKNVQEIYGYSNCDPSIAMRNSFRGDMDVNLIWMGQQELVEGLQAMVAELESKDVRTIEEEVTNEAFAERQGRSRRS